MSIVTLANYPSNMPNAEQEAEALLIIKSRKTALDQQKKDSTLTCPCCQHQQLVKDSTHITNQWYERPYGCTGGDNYHTSYGKDEYICTQCNEHVRLPADWNSQEGKFYFGHAHYFQDRKYKHDGELSDVA